MSLLKQVRKALFFHGEQGIEKKVLCIPFVNQLVGMFLEPFVSSFRGIDVKVPLLNPWVIAWQFMDTLIAPPILVASPVIV